MPREPFEDEDARCDAIAERRARSAEATAASLSEAAAGLRRLCPPSAKPNAAVAEVGLDK